MPGSATALRGAPKRTLRRAPVTARHAACGRRGMDDVTKAKLQVRLVVATFRQHITRNSVDGDAAAAFRERARPLLNSVELGYGTEPEVAQALAEARRELDGDAD